MSSSRARALKEQLHKGVEQKAPARLSGVAAFHGIIRTVIELDMVYLIENRVAHHAQVLGTIPFQPFLKPPVDLAVSEEDSECFSVA